MPTTPIHRMIRNAKFSPHTTWFDRKRQLYARDGIITADSGRIVCAFTDDVCLLYSVSLTRTPNELRSDDIRAAAYLHPSSADYHWHLNTALFHPLPLVSPTPNPTPRAVINHSISVLLSLMPRRPTPDLHAIRSFLSNHLDNDDIPYDIPSLLSLLQSPSAATLPNRSARNLFVD